MVTSFSILPKALPLYLTSTAAGSYKDRRRNVVCCCPWSSSEPNERRQINGLAKNKRYDNTSLPKTFEFNLVEDHTGNKSSSDDEIRSSPMEFPFPFINIILSLPFFYLIVSGWKKLTKPDKHTRLPPGPPKLPIIGHLHHLVSSVPHHYPLTDLAKKYGPLMHLKFGEVNTIIVSSADIAKDFLRTHELSCVDRPKSVATEIMWYNHTDIVFSPYGDYWRQMRKICILELLSTKNVRSFEYIRADEASSLVEFIKLNSGEPFNLTERIFWFMSCMTCRAAFGDASIDRDAAIKLLKKALSLAGQFDLADLFPSVKIFNYIGWNKYALLKLRKQLDEILDKVIDEHTKKMVVTGKCSGELGTEDLVDVLLRLKDSGELALTISNDNIKSIIFDMFGGGTDTSSTTVDWAMAELMKNPRVMAKAQAEIRQSLAGKKKIEAPDIHSLKYLKLVINEVLRLHPPASLIPRACREEFEINGYEIPLNANIIINIWVMGRDPCYWDNPESFEPERFEAKNIDFLGNHFEYIPFGSGRRICPGMAFGIANVEYLLAQLLYHFEWELPQGVHPGDIDMTEVDGFVISRKNGLCLIAKPYYV